MFFANLDKDAPVTLSLSQLSDIINQVLEESGRSKFSDPQTNSHLRNDIGFDSLDLAVLSVKIEAQTSVDVFNAGIVNTVGEVLERVNDK